MREFFFIAGLLIVGNGVGKITDTMFGFTPSLTVGIALIASGLIAVAFSAKSGQP